jgi:hypothetical protein
MQGDSKLLSVFPWPIIFQLEERESAYGIRKFDSKSFIWQL